MSNGAPRGLPLNDASRSVISADAQSAPDESFAGCALGLGNEQPALTEIALSGQPEGLREKIAEEIRSWAT